MATPSILDPDSARTSPARRVSMTPRRSGDELETPERWPRLGRSKPQSVCNVNGHLALARGIAVLVSDQAARFPTPARPPRLRFRAPSPMNARVLRRSAVAVVDTGRACCQHETGHLQELGQRLILGCRVGNRAHPKRVGPHRSRRSADGRAWTRRCTPSINAPRTAPRCPQAFSFGGLGQRDLGNVGMGRQPDDVRPCLRSPRRRPK